MRKTNLLWMVGAVVAATMTAAAAQESLNPRFGKWKLKSDRPAPYLNIMTYEPYGEGGMRITIEATNAKAANATPKLVSGFAGASAWSSAP